MASTWRQRITAVAPLLGVAVLALLAPGDDGPTFCPIAILTGTACPGCGLTRATSALVRGDLTAALSHHPLVLLIAVQLIGAWWWLMLRRWGLVRPMSPRALNLSLFGTAVALLAVWGLRMAVGSLPSV